MIVIFSDTTDVHADAVEAAAPARGGGIIRLNRDQLHRWSLEFLCGEPLVTLDEQIFNLDTIHSIFIRRLPDRESFKKLCITGPPEASDYIALQRFGLMSECVALMSERTRAINTMASAQRAQAKATQLFVAGKIGLRTPKTYSGANPDMARKHIDALTLTGGRVCTKPILNGFLALGGGELTRFTELLDESDLAELDSLRECPLTIQDYIEKAYEVRVTVVGNRAFACKIDSQAPGGNTSVDWRRYNIPKTPHSQYTLPSNIREQLLSFHAYFGLAASSFDLIRSHEGEYVFLESNPYGQWLWIEDLTGLQITAAIADFLLQ
jgi:hypothetical protein